MSTFKWAFVGDLQIPYEDKRAVELWFKVMKAWKPDAIDIVGDIDDQLEYSTFSDGTTDEFLNQLKVIEKNNDKLWTAYQKAIEAGEDLERPGLEVPVLEDTSPLNFIKANADGAKQFYARVSAEHPKADKHASLGNHDIRIFKYMNKKIPDHYDQLTPNMLWGLDDAGFTWRMYSEKPFERFAGIHVHHGDTTTTTGLGVRNDIENYDVSLVRGHDHRGGVVYKSYPLSGRVLRGMGTGHMCDPNAYGLQYTINPTWELGFGIAHVFGENVQLQFVPITPDYECVVDGRLFKG